MNILIQSSGFASVLLATVEKKTKYDIILQWNWTSQLVNNQPNLCKIHLSESYINPYFNIGGQLRNLYSRLLQLWTQNISRATPNMEVTQGFNFLIKHWPWLYLNSRYTIIYSGHTVVDPYSIINFYWTNNSREVFLGTSQHSAHHYGPWHIEHCLDRAHCYPILMWGTSPT